MLEKIREWLSSKLVEFKEVHHQETKTSEEAAKARGEDISVGGKAIVLKVGDRFNIFVLSAAKKLDSSAIKSHFNAKNTRFATRDELLELTGLVPGSVPPFGKPLIDLDLYVDNSIVSNERIAFNAGSLTDSIVMSTKYYLDLSKPIIFNFSK